MPNNRRNFKSSQSSYTPPRRIRGNSQDVSEMFGTPDHAKLEAHMADVRRQNASLHAEASFGPGGAGVFGPSGQGLQMATSRPRDPMFYWRQNNLPFDFTKPAELRKIREFCRLLYMTHAVVAACVDIYSKLPLQGMHIKCKDEQLVEFYTDLFINQLNYEDHLVKMGRQYWLSGECFSIGAWNEDLGVWEDEQLINPDDVEVESSLFLTAPRFMMRLPESLRTILTERSPAYEYQKLMQEYPELAQYTGEDDLMPVSNYIMYQLRFEADDYSNRGVSILMRAFRTLIQEEMLMSALDAIADRLYTPFIIAKLGASATDLGTQVPWIPTGDQKAEFGQAMDAALAADFRVLVTHFATEVESLFGRENVPDLTNDFDRINERILMAFGLSQTMLTGASAGETYAADALNRDVVTQLLSHYQRKLKQFFTDRASIVAEASEHFDYEVRNGERYLVTEEIYEVDEETGEGRIIEQPKLLVPELDFKILNLTDEQAERDFIESLAMSGVPIPIRMRVQSTGIDFDEMREIKKQEIVDLAVDEQEARKETYKALLAAGLPIPDDLLKDFQPLAMQGPGAQGPPPGASDVNIPSLGATPQILPNMAPAPEDLQGDQMVAGQQMDQQETNEETDPAADLPQEGDDVPAESNEQKARMPKPASLKYDEDGKIIPTYDMWRKFSRAELELPETPKPVVEAPRGSKLRTKAIRKLGIRNVTASHWEEPDNSIETNPAHFQPTGRYGKPKHIGMRRYIKIPDDLNLRVYEEKNSES